MAAGIQWTAGRSLAMPSFNPTAALNGANSAISNLNRQVSDIDNQRQRKDESDRRLLFEQQKAKVAAQDRADRLNWTMGAEQRETDKRAANYNATNKLFGSAVDGQEGLMPTDTGNIDAANSLFGPRADGTTVSQGITNYRSENPNNYLDAKTLEQSVVAGLQSQGIEVNEATVSAGMSERGFTKSSAAQIEAQIANLPGVAQYKDGSSKGAPKSGSAEYIAGQKFVDESVDNLSIPADNDGWLFMNNSANKESMKKAITSISGTGDVATPFVLAAMMQEIEQGKAAFDMSDLTKDSDKYKQLEKDARVLRDQAASGGGNSGGSVEDFNNTRTAQANAIRKTGSYQNVSTEQRRTSMMEYLKSEGFSPKEAEAEAKEVIEAEDQQILTDDVLAAVGADSGLQGGGGMMPPPENYSPNVYEGDVEQEYLARAAEEVLASNNGSSGIMDFLNGGTEKRIANRGRSLFANDNIQGLRDHGEKVRAFEQAEEQKAYQTKAAGLRQLFQGK
jgi:hypothetical protein